MQSARRSAIPSRCSIAASSNIPASEVIRPPSKAICTGLPATAGKPGRIPVLSSMSPARSVLLDLDGTLIDTQPGIFASCLAALRALGHDPGEALDIKHVIG